LARKRKTPRGNEHPGGGAGTGERQFGGGEAGAGQTSETFSQDVLGDFAEDLGQFLGRVQNRASSWLDQRQSIVEQLTQIRDTANGYLQQLIGEAGIAAPALRGRRGRRGRRAGAGVPAARKTTRRRKRFTMSAEARARIAEAQRKRWAKQRRAKAQESQSG